MKPRISVITLGVDDLDEAVRFYRDGLGLPTDGIIGEEFEYGAVAFFDLSSGLKLAVWPRKSLAHDTGLALQPSSATEFSIGHNVTSKSEVDGVMTQAVNAGAVIVKGAQETFWGGYAGFKILMGICGKLYGTHSSLPVKTHNNRKQYVPFERRAGYVDCPGGTAARMYLSQ